jgi:hypothetical protein
VRNILPQGPNDEWTSSDGNIDSQYLPGPDMTVNTPPPAEQPGIGGVGEGTVFVEVTYPHGLTYAQYLPYRDTGRFPVGSEVKYPDGSVEVPYPYGEIHRTEPDGQGTVILPDGREFDADRPGGFIQMFPTVKDPTTGELRSARPDEVESSDYRYDPTAGMWILLPPEDQPAPWVPDQPAPWVPGQGGDRGEATSSADPGGPPKFAGDVPPVDQQPPPVDQQPADAPPLGEGDLPPVDQQLPPVDQQPPPVDQQQPVDTPTLREGVLPPVDVPPTDLPPLGEDVPPPLEEQPTIGAQGTEELPPVDELGTTEPSTPTLAPNLLDPTAPGATLDNGLVPRIEQSPELTNAVNQNEDVANALERDPSSLDQIEQDLGLSQPSGVPVPSGAPEPGLGEPDIPEPPPPDQDPDDIVTP